MIMTLKIENFKHEKTADDDHNKGTE